MVAEDGEHSFREENRAAPAVRDAHGGKGWVQMADAVFEPAETLGGFASANVVPLWGKPLRDKPLGGTQRGKPLGGRPLRGKPAQTVSASGNAKRHAGRGGDEAGAEDDAIRFEQASPQIGKVK